jgi:hypothetical protein
MEWNHGDEWNGIIDGMTIGIMVMIEMRNDMMIGCIGANEMIMAWNDDHGVECES